MYNHKEIEKKWQDYWDKNKIFKTENDFSKPKWYSLDMFPYPSGAGLHVGHPEGYTANDILSRYKKAKGYNVLHPMGWDAFGLPAENYAIKTGTHPRITTDQNIKTFKTQTKKLGFSYDWDREIDTTDPSYYKWTQWIFLKLFEHGLAYEQDLPINYCPSCKTGLANEEVLNDFTCERCGTKVEKKKIRQWVLAITKYADRLLKDVDKLDWPEGIKDMQRNWIGKSEGCEFEMKKSVDNKPLAIILHGWRDDENDKPWHWMNWLKINLESIGYEVELPILPDPSRPNLEKQLEFLKKYENRITEDSVVIGHSMGGFLAMHFVERLNKKINKLICVAPCFNDLIKYVDWSNLEGWEIGSKSMKINYNPEKIKKNSKDWQVFLSKNDEFILYSQAKEHFDIIGITHIDIENAGHFCEGDGFVKFPQLLNKISDSIKVYTTRIDTVFGMTYAVLAPDHPQVLDFITLEQKKICLDYIDNSKKKSDQDRTADNKEKTGVFTGSYVVNPYNNEKVPLWIADYVLGNYGTGAVMAVPAHDERDFEFAKKYDLSIKQSIANLFCKKESKDTVREDKETVRRNTIVGVLKDNKNGKIFVLEWNKTGWKTFLVGGIEENESQEEAVLREVREESGYQNINIVKNLGCEYHNSFFAHHKDVNRYAVTQAFLLELVDDTYIKPKEEETINHKGFWLEEDKIDEFITLENYKYVWNSYKNGETAFTNDGILVNSGDFDGLTTNEARQKLTEYAEQNGFGTKKVNFKLRDWLYSRQRYWGEPIPLIHLEEKDVLNLPNEDLGDAWVKNGNTLMIGNKEFSKIYDGLYGKIVCDYNLPLKLPQVENYEPAGDGNSPLIKVLDFVNVKLAKNLSGKRETNTMPQWGGSCWYYLRFMDPKNDKELVNPEVEKYWGQVDSYVGGAEHAVLHLLYARFWHKFLFDIKVVSHDEPFYRLRNQGLILAHAFQRKNGGLLANDLVEEKNGKYYEIANGEEVNRIISKMSKSLKNVINPDDIVEEYGADSLRLYEMYMAEFKDTAPWDTKGIVGVRRFIEKSERLFTSEAKFSIEDDNSTMKLLHKTIKKVEEDIENYKFNTAIAALMILVNNGLPKDNMLQIEWKNVFIRLLHPFTPHLAEELWEKIGEKKSVFASKWPEYDKNLIIDDTITIGVQVLGKLRGEIEIAIDENEKQVLEKARNNENVKKWLNGKVVVKEIYVKGKIVNLVVR